MKRSQRALLGLINNVLNFVRLDAGHVELNVSDTPAADILKEVDPLVAPQLEAKGLHYDFTCENGAAVRADPEKTQLSAVFEPFVQLDRTLNSAHQGTGLGLAISRDLALQMKGSLTVESDVGKGCVFLLSLPAGQAT